MREAELKEQKEKEDEATKNNVTTDNKQGKHKKKGGEKNNSNIKNSCLPNALPTNNNVTDGDKNTKKRSGSFTNTNTDTSGQNKKRVVQFSSVVDKK